jgi:hypothetical protein
VPVSTSDEVKSKAGYSSRKNDPMGNRHDRIADHAPPRHLQGVP